MPGSNQVKHHTVSVELSAGGRPYTYLIASAQGHDYAKGDYAIVPSTKGGFTVGKVTGVDDDPSFPKAGINYLYAVGRVDKALNNQLNPTRSVV